MVNLLVVYDQARGRLVRQKVFAQRPEAWEARLKAEQEFRGRPEIEIVILRAATLDDLCRTHGRYFLEPEMLLDRMG